MILELSFDSEVPLYLQLRNQIVKGIANGNLKLNESLPTVRQLADEAGINPMTVNKAYGLLKREGYIVIDRRHGAKVNTQFSKRLLLTPEMEGELVLFLCEAKLSGMTEEEILLKVQTLYRQLL